MNVRLMMILLTGLALVTTTQAGDLDKHLIVVYFNPADREPIPGYRDRIERVMTDLQEFFRDEMQRNGFGPMTFPLERDQDGRLVVHVVQSDPSYARGEALTWGDLCAQVKEGLARDGLDMDQEYVITFQNLLFSEDGEIRGWMPYWGNGDHVRGHATVPDHALLDPANLLKAEPMVNDAGRVRPLGEYVRVQLGGMAQKIGHSFGLPHNRETPEQLKTVGTAVMGSGNYTYRRELTGKGLGAILTEAHARALSLHPLFARNAKDRTVRPSCELEDVRFTHDGPRLKISGRVQGSPPVVALVAYLDPAKGRRDYDARSWVAKLECDGRFEVLAGDFEPGGYELRLRFYHRNGAHKVFEYRFVVDESGAAPVEYLARQDLYQKDVLPAFEVGDEPALRTAISKLEEMDDVWYRKARVLYGFLTQASRPPTVELSAVAEDVREVWLGSIAWESATVGWGKPSRNRRADTGYVLESGHDVHATGLFAHAPSRYVYRLGGRWKRLESAYGLQNWSPGSVVFVVKGDGKELFRSSVVRDWKEGRLSVGIAGVDRLELIVEPTDDGTYADNSIWFSPRLTR